MFLDSQKIVSALGVRAGQHVADLGCGTGYFSIELARAVGKDGVVSAVDIMQEPLDSVRARSESLGLGNIRAIRANLEVLGGTAIPDNSQDLALLANTLFQSQKKDAILAEAVRILKPGGRLVVIDWKKGAVGFGPPDELRTDEQAMRALAVAAKARFDGTIDAGTFYYGLVFKK
jgi:ubiquinone/menaquinone biosynthesis C-methylase UbiE